MIKSNKISPAETTALARLTQKSTYAEDIGTIIDYAKETIKEKIEPKHPEDPALADRG